MAGRAAFFGVGVSDLTYLNEIWVLTGIEKGVGGAEGGGKGLFYLVCQQKKRSCVSEANFVQNIRGPEVDLSLIYRLDCSCKFGDHSIGFFPFLEVPEAG